ncbi:MAG: hypothetical protein P8X74_14865 [Reinekea sp.]
MSVISLRTGIEQMSVFTAEEDRHLPKPQPFLNPGVKVTSHLRQLYRQKAEWSLLETFVKPELGSHLLFQTAEFDRCFREVRKLFMRLAEQSPEDRELVARADAILAKNQKNLRCLAEFRHALIGA